MTELSEARITSERCLNRAVLHEYLHDALRFPDYYGNNLSALADCLAEASSPKLVTFAVNADTLPTDMQAYVLKLVQVCAREALANECVSVIVEHDYRS